MLAMTFQCEVPDERTLVVKLPDSVQPGTHEVVVILDKMEARGGNSAELKRFVGAVPSFSGVDAVALQHQFRDEWQ